MRIWKTTSEWIAHRRTISSLTIGFVPTMGALHRGHVSLVERCRAENDITVVSIFVNPSQFNEAKDLDRYPRPLDCDLALLDRLQVDDLLLPEAIDLYPHGYRFRIEADSLTKEMEASHRPGFLQGVMTVVLKLLNLVRADRAYFGEKDYQQLRTIAAMVEEFFIPTEIVPCATIREPSGLAESSRNALLSVEARAKAVHIFRALTTSADPRQARSLLETEGFQVDYVEDHWDRRFAAALLEGVRLIDNVPIAERQ